jgi:hypothetical protein
MFGLELCVIIRLGMLGMVVEVYLFDRSPADLGDSGVLGGVGGWLGGEPPSTLPPGFSVKFSKILPATRRGDNHH